MGITGLLPFVKEASSNSHISKFRGQTVAVDAYCWLHKGAFGCAEKLAMGEKTDGYVYYCFKYIDMLLTYNIKPIMVFDGRHLPAKKLTEEKRRKNRSTARKRAVECLKLGKIEEARMNFRKCVDITPEMALALMTECRKKGIDYVVAPYEADAQLAYLNRSKIADFIISEDSDLIAFGCTMVLFKLDLSGTGTLVEQEKLHLTTRERQDEFSIDRFRHMCILSGCDYLDSLPGIGLKKALKFLKRVYNSNIYDSLSKLPSILNMKQLTITKEYRDQFMIADATFRHQLIFNVFERKLIPLTDPADCATNLAYCCNAGDMLDDAIAFQIAIGNLNPFTLEALSKWNLEEALKTQKNFTNSIWGKFSNNRNKRKFIDFFLPKQKKTAVAEDTKLLETVSETFDDTNDNNINDQLIAIYSCKEQPEAKRACIRDQEAADETKENNITTNKSPVLLRRQNPFLKKSQINRTIIDDKTIVVSKYFSNGNICPEQKIDDQAKEDEDDKQDCSNRCSDDNSTNSLITKIVTVKLECETSVSTTDAEVKNTRNDYFNKKSVQKTTATRRVGLSKKIQIKHSKLKLAHNQPTLLSMFSFKN